MVVHPFVLASSLCRCRHLPGKPPSGGLEGQQCGFSAVDNRRVPQATHTGNWCNMGPAITCFGGICHHEASPSLDN